MLPEDIPEEERDDEESKTDGGSGHIQVSKDNHWEDKTVVVVSSRVSKL